MDAEFDFSDTERQIQTCVGAHGIAATLLAIG